MSTNRQSNGNIQFMIKPGIAARATLGGSRCAYYPLNKPTKFLVTLKPVSKAETTSQHTTGSTSGCCCNESNSAKVSKMNPASKNSLTSNPNINVFRVLTNSNFISIDPTYNLSKDPILASTVDNARLSAGGAVLGKPKSNKSEPMKKDTSKKSEERKQKGIRVSARKEEKKPIANNEPTNKVADTEPQPKPVTTVRCELPASYPLNCHDVCTNTSTVLCNKGTSCSSEYPLTPPQETCPESHCKRTMQYPGISIKARLHNWIEQTRSCERILCATPVKQCECCAIKPPKPRPPPKWRSAACEQNPRAEPQTVPPPQKVSSVPALSSRGCSQCDVPVPACSPSQCPADMTLPPLPIVEHMPPKRLTFVQEEIESSERTQTTTPSNKFTTTEDEAQTQSEECADNNWTLQNVATRIFQQVASAVLSPENQETANKYVVEICKPRLIRNNSTSHVEPQKEGKSPNELLEQQCTRIQQLEAEVVSMRGMLEKMQGRFMPQKDVARATELSQKLQDLNTLLVEMKKQQNLATQKHSRQDVDKELIGNKASQEKQRVNLGVQVGIHASVQDNQSQTPPSSFREGECQKPIPTQNHLQSPAPSPSQQPKPRPDDRYKKCPPIKPRSRPERSQSVCPFCEQGRSVQPVLSKELFESVVQRVGQHSERDIVLAVVLQPDNVYHINVATISTNQTLGCIYAYEEAIVQAHEDNLFEEFLTFFIVDAHNNETQKFQTLGHAFEFFKKID